MLTFNAILDAAVQLDSSRWCQTAWLHRAAAHADGKEFGQMVDKAWGNNLQGAEKKKSKGFSELLRDFGSGF